MEKNPYILHYPFYPGHAIRNLVIIEGAFGEKQLKKNNEVNSSSGISFDSACSLFLTLGGLAICSCALYSILIMDKNE